MRCLAAAGLAGVTVLVAACGDGGADGASLRVFAASSLTGAFADVAAAFEAAHPGVEIVLNLAGSSSLREQVLAGAPADVFASADQSNVDALVAAGATEGEPAPFVTNSLQLVVPADNPGAVDGLDDLARGELLVGLCAVEVPCGELAGAALASAGVEPSVDTEEPDVRSLLTKVAAGELDAGVVYRTDVIAAGDDVLGIDIPPEHDAVATYPIVVLSDLPLAADFVAFVLGAAGQSILAAHGFGPPR